MLLKQFPHKIMWLASYPKSGNTWFRAFLTALLGDNEVDLNNLTTHGMFASREMFERITGIDSRDLYQYETKLMIADVLRTYAAENAELSVFKIHDAFELDKEGKSIVPEDVTHCAIYFIRNPLDIVASLANHNNSDIDNAIEIINNKTFLANQSGNLNRLPQIAQSVLNWSEHVESWTLSPAFKVIEVRYEDMLSDPFITFEHILKEIGWDVNPEKIQEAIKLSNFEVLKNKEKENGFREKLRNENSFFRAGKSGNWKNELTKMQIEKIVLKHWKIMDKYKYDT